MRVGITPMQEVSAPLLSHPHSLRPGSLSVSSPTDIVAGAAYFSDSTEHRSPQEPRNVPPAAAPSRPSHESDTLPNPYESDTPPCPPPRDETAPLSPTATTSRRASSSWMGDSSHSSGRRSTAPSAWTHDESGVALLSRGTTQTSHRTSASSSLHGELAGYQKALEAHHRKESEDAAIGGGLGESSRVPVDPPPQYTPSGGA